MLQGMLEAPHHAVCIAARARCNLQGLCHHLQGLVHDLDHCLPLTVAPCAACSQCSSDKVVSLCVSTFATVACFIKSAWWCGGAAVCCPTTFVGLCLLPDSVTCPRLQPVPHLCCRGLLHQQRALGRRALPVEGREGHALQARRDSRAVQACPRQHLPQQDGHGPGPVHQ